VTPARLVVASTNPVKIESARLGFELAFPGVACTVLGVPALSGVRDQPMGDDETLRGAFNRATAAQNHQPDADYWLGIEGGCADTPLGMTVFAWAVVIGKGRIGRARTGTFFLPDEVAALVRGGMELGHADDAVFGRSNSKQADGSVGLLTGGAIDRTRYYSHAVTLAFVPFLNPALTFAG
jgi:inosine/xanthosine triphosphatase